MSPIYPYYGKVFLTDYNTSYPDASDHNLVKGSLTIDDGTAAETGAQVATFNVRRYGFDPEPYDWDINRDHECAQVITDSGCSVLALQECEPEQDAYLDWKLPQTTGVTWGTVSEPTNVSLMYKSDRWRLLDQWNITMDNGTEPDRRLVLGLLESVRTGSEVWFGSTHFGVGAELASYRLSQAHAIGEFLKNVPGYGDVRSRAVIMGDFNDYAPYTSTGVRQVFNTYGFRELRDRLSDADFYGDTFRTNHGFGSLTIRDGRQIDAIFTHL